MEELQRDKYKVRKSSNKLVGLAVVVIVAALVIVLNAHGKDIQARNNKEIAMIEQLQSEKEEELKRANKLAEYSKYVNTKQFIEEIARKRMGLIYPDEIIFKGE